MSASAGDASEPVVTGRHLLFGEFDLDREAGRLVGPEGPVSIAPKALSLLDYLAARPGRLVSKQELLEAVWPGVFVADGVLKVCIRDVRRALGDAAGAPRFIETAHRRGYRFIAPIAEPTGAGRLPSSGFERPGPALAPDGGAIHYARSGDVNIAYQVVGDGPIDLVFVMGWVSHLEYFWKAPTFARFLQRLASFSRLILFDKRGTGLSDRVLLPTLETRMDDVRAVLDAVGSRRAALLGVSEGGPMCSLFAATYPDSTEALVMIGTYAKRLRADDYPWAPTREQREAFCEQILEQWGGPVGIAERAPSLAGDPEFREWWAAYLRMGASPSAAVALTRMNAEIDVRHILPTVRVPTLVLHRSDDKCLLVEEGRYVASLIPNARFVELPGADHLPFAGDQDAMLDEIERFLTMAHDRARGDRVLATVLCCEAAAPADRDGEGRRALVQRVATRFGGTAIRLDRGHVFSMFDGPARAIRCGATVAAEAARAGTPMRIGLHTGECDLVGGMPGGVVFEIAARVAAFAAPGEVRVSRTVVDLVAGSGLEFVDRGTHRLADSAAPWHVFSVQP